jgi:peroxiredoxin
VLAVSVDPPEVSEALRERLDTPITFLSDRDGELMDRLNVRDRGGMPAWVRETRGEDIFLPTSFLVDEKNVIRWVYRPDTYRVRAPASQVLAEIDRLG